MAYIAISTSRMALAFLAMLIFVVGGGGAEEKDRRLLNFVVKLPDESGRVEFFCDLGREWVEASNSIHIHSSELNLMEEVLLSDDTTKGLGEFVCWQDKPGISVAKEIFEDLGSQIQRFFSYRLRSLLQTEGKSAPGPKAPEDGTEKSSEDSSSAGDPSKKDKGEPPVVATPVSKTDEEAKDGTGNPPAKGNKDPAVEEKSDPSSPPKVEPPPPPTDEEKEKEGEKGTPVNPGNQSQHDADDSKYNVCEEGKDLVTRLQPSGDGTQTLTLSLRNDGDGVLDVQIKTPLGLLADPSRVHLKKGEPALKVNISVVDEALLANEETPSILISSSEGECIVPISLDVLGDTGSQSYFDRFSMRNMPAVVTPEMRVGVFFFVVSIIGGVVIWRTWARWRRSDGGGAGHSYQELEMTLPSIVDTSTSGYGQEKDNKSGSGDEDGWDEAWEDWEDTEAARSSSRLIPSLSAKGLAARRSNKDGWENSWDD